MFQKFVIMIFQEFLYCRIVSVYLKPLQTILLLAHFSPTGRTPEDVSEASFCKRCNARDVSALGCNVTSERYVARITLRQL